MGDRRWCDRCMTSHQKGDLCPLFIGGTPPPLTEGEGLLLEAWRRRGWTESPPAVPFHLNGTAYPSAGEAGR
jgi:hypothetical protein